MNKDELQRRTKRFALEVIRFVRALARDGTSNIIGRQLLRAGTSVGANYRGACRARSRADFVAKMGIVEEEVDESLYWLQLLEEAGLCRSAAAQPLAAEATELLAIVVASIRTARAANSRAGGHHG